MAGIARAGDDRQIGLGRAQAADQPLHRNGFIHGEDNRGGIVQPQPLKRIVARGIGIVGDEPLRARRLDQFGIDVDRHVSLAVLPEHFGNQPPDASAADHDRVRIGQQFIGVRVPINFDPPPQPAPGNCQNRGDGQPQRGHDFPELPGRWGDQLARLRRAEHDQGRFGGAGKQDADLGRRPHPRPRQPQQGSGNQRLDPQHQRGGQQDFAEPRPDDFKVEPHADGEQEHPQREPLERGDHVLDLAVVFGLGDQQPGDQRTNDWREPDRAGRERGEDYHQQADRKEQLGAFGPRSLIEQPRQDEPPADQQAHYDNRAEPQRAQQRTDVAAIAIAAERAEQEDNRHQCHILEQQHGRRGAAHRGVLVGDAQHQRGRGQCQRQPKGSRGDQRIAQHHQHRANQQRATQQFHRTQPEDRAAHRPQPSERQLQPDREQQQHDAEFGEGFKPNRVADGDVGQPWMCIDGRAQPVWPDHHADQDEPDHRGNPEPREQRDDDPGSGEDYQRIAKRRRGHEGHRSGHTCVVAMRRALVTPWRLKITMW